METNPHILIVDDDRELRDLLSRFLTANGFRVTVARDAREMSKALEDAAIDLVVLDVMMPGKDGFTACRELRATSDVPLIMLTAVGDPTDRIVGLELGADDYLPKPFNSRELLARMRALLRRSVANPRRVNGGTTEKLQFAGWTLEVGRRCLLSPEGTMVTLSTGEFDLLLAFLEPPQRTLTRDQPPDPAPGRRPVPFHPTLAVPVPRAPPHNQGHPRLPQIIATVRGDGYMLATNVVRT